ncbi:MAG: flavodoxin domain-containing protein [Salinivirgaceae bacterium]|nr:flavodoxin domain-containing protein [Salinivirgaceae bacterium]
MEIIIIYASRHGSTEKAAKMLEAKLSGNVSLFNIKKKAIPPLENYDLIFLGGSIHAGEIQQKLKRFIKKNEALLSKKQLGLFLCCMDKEKAQLQFEHAYPEILRKNAVCTGLFGGEFNFEKMNWLERLATKKIAGVHKTVSEIDEEAIFSFTEKINSLAQ